jgi:hypothetical protein
MAPPQNPNCLIIDRVHNIGICLATGAFCTSCLENLYVRFGEPPLSLRRNHLLYDYAVKLKTQPHHSSHCVVFHPTSKTGKQTLDLWVCAFTNFYRNLIYSCCMLFLADYWDVHMYITNCLCTYSVLYSRHTCFGLWTIISVHMWFTISGVSKQNWLYIYECACQQYPMAGYNYVYTQYWK